MAKRTYLEFYVFVEEKKTTFILAVFHLEKLSMKYSADSHMNRCQHVLAAGGSV